MFKIGSCVVYRAHGVCKVVDIKKENFGQIGAEKSYYILRPDNEINTVFYVPADNEDLTSLMRNIMSADEMLEAISTAQISDLDWIEDNRQRSTLSNEILSSVDLERIMGMLKMLYTQRDSEAEKGKKMKINDENLVKKAEKLLFDELSLVLDIDADDIKPIILGEKIPQKKIS